MSLTLLEPTTMDAMVVQCENYSKHGIPTGWCASREFKLDEDELNFMNHLSREDQKRIWKIHFDTGRCVPCMIDEWRDSNRFPSIARSAPIESYALVIPKKERTEEKMKPYGPYRNPGPETPSKDAVPDNDSANILQKLLQLILALERAIAGCFSK